MKRLANEVDASFGDFTSEWNSDFKNAIDLVGANALVFKTSYRRLVSLQAWRSELLESALSKEALGFFVEAQNDGVVSHVLASLGCWRPALQALRSVIENSYRTLYYMDHPVELSLWEQGKHRLSRKELEDYLEIHPALGKLEIAKMGLSILSKQYAILNHAVHASSKGFRMTNEKEELQLAIADNVRSNKWHTNERDTIVGLNLLLLTFFRSELQGASKRNLRKAVSLEFSDDLRNKVKAELNITLPKP